MLTSVAGTDFTLASGSVVDLPTELAMAFVKANYAERVEQSEDAVGDEEKYETRPLKRKYERRNH